MIKTQLCDKLGIEYPLFQGGMAWVSDASLASAVSNGGGLGLIAAANMPPELVRAEIRKAKELTNRPFGVNIMLMSPYAEEIAALVIEEGVQIVTTGAGLPAKYMPAWLGAGISVIPVVPSAAIARKVERSGATAVVAEGCESGGHIGELTTMALVPQVCDAVEIPVIAAGGIADGRGVAAALMLGACGVQIGTRFLVAEECTIHPNYKQKVLSAKDTDTMATGRRLGHPVRAVKNPFTRAFLKKEYDSTCSDQELEHFGEGALRKAAVEGDEKEGCFLAGQVAGLVRREQPAAEIIREMFEQAEQVLKGGSIWVK